ncbi:MAG TPA: carboxypeptidase regulatory-like domain-containing protein, partial [Bryobacteraceae bacterium]
MIRSILFGSIALSLPGQVDRATLSGTVTDPSGAVITDASVEADSITTGKAREAVTNSAGIYGLPKLAPGTYNITFKKQGFQTVRFESVDIQVGKNVTLDARMNLAPVSTAVDVQAAAPLLERSSADYAGVVDREQIENLPTNGRNWSTLLILTPLAIDDGGGDQRSIRFAGRARDDNNYRMDGIDATGIQEQAQKSTTRLQIPADAVQEYRVGSGLYTAEYGAGSGGQVDVVTKSGSNVFHGSAFDYLRNSVFDSRSFLDLDLDPAATGPTKVPAFRMNQFGGTLGGPLVQNKTFFFASFEAIRQFRGETLHALVPSAGFKAQVLAQSPALASIL